MSKWTVRKPKAANARHQSGTRTHPVPPVEWCPPGVAEGALTHAHWARLRWGLLDLPRGHHPSGRREA
jgi:hypothetical protein